MSCKYCTELEECDLDEKEDFTIMCGPELELMSPECSMRASLGYWGSIADPEDRTWGINIIVDEEWHENIPIKVGTSFESAYKDNRFNYEFKSGFECHEVVIANYCPMCGEKLGGGS